MRITDITNNQTGSTSLTSSLFNPGITSTVGAAKRWLTPGPTPPGWVSPGPPCTITNSHGTVATFVEIDGIRRVGIVNEDCTGNYDAVNGGTSNGGSYCDSTFNMYDPVVLPNYSGSCTSATDPTCYGRIHIEIDHDWKAAGYCGPSTTCDDGALGSQTTTSSLIDIQGFISWDPGNLAQSWHSFNGWEIHPITGWRLHQSSSNPDFSISASPTGVLALAGATGTSTVSVTPLNGFTGTVFLAPSVSPSGLTCALNPTSVVLGGSQTSNLSCNGPAGTYTVTVAGTSGSLSHSTTVTFTITDFTINASPTSVALSVGSSGTSTITVSSVNGFNSAVTLSSSVSPSVGLACNLSLTSISGSGTSNLSCTASSAGSFNVAVTGASGSLSHSTNVAYTASSTDFSVSASPTSVSVISGSTGVSTITVSPVNGFPGTVTLAASASPGGLSCSLSPTSFALGASQTSTLSCNGPTGTYTVTVTGTSSSLSRSISVKVIVSDFSLTASPNSLSLPRSSTASSLITLTSLNGFNGTVTLSATIRPTGPRLSLSITLINLRPNASGTSTLTIRTGKRTPAGSYIVTITATSGSLKHVITLQVTVT